MSYQVLARKWRPRRFEELVGQTHVVRPLVNALDNDRLHHAFLFTGTRGVGKTTIARILAKSLNCEQGVSSTPCGECTTCREVDEGRFVDLIEVDAASRTKVDDTRELLDNVQYAPTRGRYKVYLIDEVHMLSNSSFNALLKTLEEPPPHVKFLLATTDPQKLPMTILSRCLQFSLKRLDQAQIAGQLQQILESENIEFESAALDLLAHGADGSMRDGLSLLDQAIAFGDGRVAEAPVRDMLGTIDGAALENLLEGLATSNGQTIMDAVAQVVSQGRDAADVLDRLALVFHRLALCHTEAGWVSGEEDEGRLALAYKTRFGPEDVQLCYQIALHGKRDLPLAPDPRTGLEMTLLRMLAFRPLPPGGGDETARRSSTRATRGKSVSADERKVESAAVENQAREEKQETVAAPARMAGTEAANDAAVVAESRVAMQVNAGISHGSTQEASDWPGLVASLQLDGFVDQLARHSALVSVGGADWHLVLDGNCSQLRSAEREQSLADALSSYTGKPVKLHIVTGEPPHETPAACEARRREELQARADASIENDPNIKALQSVFDARIEPGTIKIKV